MVSSSSVEAEYWALHHSTKDLTWLRIPLSKLRFGPKKPMVLFCDNMTTIEIANNLVQHNWTKHIELDRNYIKDNLDFGMIKVLDIKGVDQQENMMNHVVTSGLFYASYWSWACMISMHQLERESQHIFIVVIYVSYNCDWSYNYDLYNCILFYIVVYYFI